MNNSDCEHQGNIFKQKVTLLSKDFTRGLEASLIRTLESAGKIKEFTYVVEGGRNE